MEWDSVVFSHARVGTWTEPSPLSGRRDLPGRASLPRPSEGFERAGPSVRSGSQCAAIAREEREGRDLVSAPRVDLDHVQARAAARRRRYCQLFPPNARDPASRSRHARLIRFPQPGQRSLGGPLRRTSATCSERARGARRHDPRHRLRRPPSLPAVRATFPGAPSRRFQRHVDAMAASQRAAQGRWGLATPPHFPAPSASSAESNANLTFDARGLASRRFAAGRHHDLATRGRVNLAPKGVLLRKFARGTTEALHSRLLHAARVVSAKSSGAWSRARSTCASSRAHFEVGSTSLPARLRFWSRSLRRPGSGRLTRSSPVCSAQPPSPDPVRRPLAVGCSDRRLRTFARAVARAIGARTRCNARPARWGT